MSRFSRRWWPRRKTNPSERFDGGDRRHLLQGLSALAGGGALAALSQPAAAKDSSDLPPPKRELTGHDWREARLRDLKQG